MKSTRQNAILEIIRDRDIDTQEELADELRKRNFSVTQATVSRDIRELRLIKVLTSSGQYKYATADKPENGLSERFHRIFSESVLGMRTTRRTIAATNWRAPRSRNTGG